MFVLLVGCLSSQQHASVSQGRICTDNFTCCHTEIEAADQTFHLTQSQYTDTGPTSPSADPIMPGAWQGSHWILLDDHGHNNSITIIDHGHNNSITIIVITLAISIRWSGTSKKKNIPNFNMFLLQLISISLILSELSLYLGNSLKSDPA